MLRLPISLVLSIALFAAVRTAAGGPAGPATEELAAGWRMSIADEVNADGRQVSLPTYNADRWHSVRRMPATVLQALEDDGTYSNLYFGSNLATRVPQDLWKHDWWYRTGITVPAGYPRYTLIFNGINYRAEVWLNGRRLADATQLVGMYRRYELDVSAFVHPGTDNVLAVKVTPERKIGAVDGVELGDSWMDWINWNYLGIKESWDSFVPDRNAGIWNKVELSYGGPVSIRNQYVSSDLPLPALRPATLAVYADLKNESGAQVSGTLAGEIVRQGRPTVRWERAVSLGAHESREVSFTPTDVAALRIERPDLWWPYTWGEPNLYELRLAFRIGEQTSDSQQIHFGIRKITQHRDSDESFPKLGKGGNFYLKINGRDYLIRGAAYTPDLLYRNDPQHDRAVMRYAKDLGVNLLRWEGKFADNEMLDLADREGMPVMWGWMCCKQWESWDKWDAEDHLVAGESMRSQIQKLRAHPAAVLWANGSDGLPPDAVVADYRRILHELHWQNAIVDTVSHHNARWDGIHMAGPYTWYPPYYWFAGTFGPTRGSSAEEGNNETIPPLESLRKFLPPDKLWPINESWYVHAGAVPGNERLENIQRALEHRYGPSASVEDFARKAQLATYENVRAQFEAYGAGSPDTHKMMVFWMLNNNWPSFFGHLFDDYFKQGGGYFGAKKALRPLAVVFDGYATQDRKLGNVWFVNQTPRPQRGLQVTAQLYDLGGTLRHSHAASVGVAEPGASVHVLQLSRYTDLGPAYFVRLQVHASDGARLAENTYWQSATDDVIVEPSAEDLLGQMKLQQTQWADFTALASMPQATLRVSARPHAVDGHTRVQITLTNPTERIAFFVRAEVLEAPGGSEILPITYDDNYVTLYPHETRTLEANVDEAHLKGRSPAVRIEGYNVAARTTALVEPAVPRSGSAR